MTDKKMADSKASREVLPRTNTNASAGADAVSDSRTFVLEVQKNLRERVRIGLSRYRGREYVEIRVWYVDGAGEFQPSRQGVMLKPSLVPQLVQGLTLAARVADPQGAQ
jgi:hypothetical protein